MNRQFPLQVQPPYQMRFAPEADRNKLINLFHTAKTALSGTKQGNSRYERLKWAAAQYHKENPEVSETGAYKDLCGITEL